MNEMQYYKSNIEDWDYKELGEVVSFEGGSQPPKKYFSTMYLKNYIRLIQIRDYKTEKYKTYIPIGMAKKFCDKNDIMIGRYGPPIFQILRGLEGAYNVALLKVIPNETKVYKDFLYYFLKNEHLFRLIDSLSQRTSGQTGVDMDVLKKYIIPMPKLKEQQKISLILSSVDEQIENNDNLIEKTKELKKGLMQKLLTKGIGHSKFKDTEIGRIPETWNIKVLGEITSIITKGTTPTTYGYNFEHEGINFIKIESINDINGTLKKDTFSKISEECHKKLSRSILEEKDILFAIAGATIGKCAIVPNDCIPANTNQALAIIRINKDIDEKFMFHQLRGPIIQNKIDNLKTNTAQPNLNLKQIGEFVVLLPTLKEQQKISLILSSVDEKIEQYQSKKEKLQELKKGLVQKLLTGKIRVQ